MNGFPVQVKSVTVSQAVNLLFSIILYDAPRRVVEFAHCRCGAYSELRVFKIIKSDKNWFDDSFAKYTTFAINYRKCSFAFCTFAKGETRSTRQH